MPGTGENLIIGMSDDTAAIIKNMSHMLQLQLNTEQQRMLQKYVLLILEGLKKQRLTGEKTKESIVYKQIYDSLYPMQLLNLRGGTRIIDLGSGAGFPGIPIKIYQPAIKMALLEANQKKAAFLKMASAKLALNDMEILLGRAEHFAHTLQHREQYDCLLSKAVANMAVLAEIGLPFLKVGGSALFYKGPAGFKEVKLAERAIQVCGGEIANDCSYTLPTGESRTLFLVKKTGRTPSALPRAAGKPQKRPLQ